MAGRPKHYKSEIDRAIAVRERSIAAARNRIAAIKARADEDIEAIEKNIRKSEVLLDALKRGVLKP